MFRAYLLFQLLVAAFFVPAAVFYEDFHSAPDLSEGWSYVETRNVELGKFNADASVDNKTACEGETNSLKIAKSKGLEDVRLEILSPFSERPLRQVSYCIKRTGTGDPSSDAFAICGQTGADGEWRTLAEWSSVSTSKQWLTNDIAAVENVNRVKFVFTASAGSCKNCSLDSLRVSDEEGEDPEEPTGSPTKPGNLKVEAIASDLIQATWSGTPGQDGYRVELFKSEDRREADTPDFSGVAADEWPVGWAHSDQGGFGWYSSDKLIKIDYNGSWLATPFYPQPITCFEYKFKSNKTSSEIENTKVVIWTSKTESGDDWVEFDRRPVSDSMETVVQDLMPAAGIRRLRFAVDYQGSDMAYAYNMLLGMRVLSVVCGENTVESAGVFESRNSNMVFSNLNATASYYVTVGPSPAEDLSLVATSKVINLANEHFRQQGAKPVTMADLAFEERFDSLSNFVTQTRTAKMWLDYWQFAMDGVELEKLGLSLTNTTPQIAGVYVCRDREKIGCIDSAMICTLAKEDGTCSVGLACRNATEHPLRKLTLTFDSLQRSFKTNPAGYVLEWRTTDGETSLAADGTWQSVDIPQTAPYTDETQAGLTEFWQRDVVVELKLKSGFGPGKVLLLRWRHPKTKSGPMMGIDNVRLAFRNPIGMAVRVK